MLSKMCLAPAASQTVSYFLSGQPGHGHCMVSSDTTSCQPPFRRWPDSSTASTATTTGAKSAPATGFDPLDLSWCWGLSPHLDSAEVPCPRAWIQFFQWVAQRNQVIRPRSKKESIPRGKFRTIERPRCWQINSLPGPSTFVLSHSGSTQLNHRHPS